MVLGVGRAEQGKIGIGRPVTIVRRGVTTRVLADLPMPATVVLDLPHPGVPSPTVDGSSHR